MFFYDCRTVFIFWLFFGQKNKLNWVAKRSDFFFCILIFQNNLLIWFVLGRFKVLSTRTTFVNHSSCKTAMRTQSWIRILWSILYFLGVYFPDTFYIFRCSSYCIYIDGFLNSAHILFKVLNFFRKIKKCTRLYHMFQWSCTLFL